MAWQDRNEVYTVDEVAEHLPLTGNSVQMVCLAYAQPHDGLAAPNAFLCDCTCKHLGESFNIVFPHQDWHGSNLWQHSGITCMSIDALWNICFPMDAGVYEYSALLVDWPEKASERSRYGYWCSTCWSLVGEAAPFSGNGSLLGNCIVLHTVYLDTLQDHVGHRSWSCYRLSPCSFGDRSAYQHAHQNRECGDFIWPFMDAQRSKRTNRSVESPNNANSSGCWAQGLGSTCEGASQQRLYFKFPAGILAILKACHAFV